MQAKDKEMIFPKLEGEVLAYWKENNTFTASVEQRLAEVNGENNAYVFYDGPPFANGLPHYGHLLTGFVKDIFARYHTMKGERVDRRFGWDCHGLPAEMEAEKELKISGKVAIEEYGMDKFNKYCQTSVMKYTQQWEEYVVRQARWVEFENSYKTMDIDYMESVIWGIKELHKKGLLYEDHRVMPYSWKCQTPLSNFETKLDNSYRLKETKTVTVKFELNEIPDIVKQYYPNAKKAFMLAWTTTPWTLPSNLALAVNKDIDYSLVEKGDEIWIMATSLLASYKKELGLQ